MSYAPQTLLDARSYLKAQTGLSDNELGIVGDQSHTYGYHLGKDRLPANDYSNRLPRDQAGLSNAASALDIGEFGRLKELTSFLVDAGRSGLTAQLRAVQGPGFPGRAYRWDSTRNWEPEILKVGDPHEWHAHLEWFRDTEFAEKVSLFRMFFEGGGGIDMSFEQSDRNMGTATTFRADALLANRDEAVFQIEGEPAVRHEPNLLKVQLDRMEEKLDRILAGPVEAFEGAEFIMTGKITHVA